MASESWVMPEWMEPYRDCIVNTGGNSVERLHNGSTQFFTNEIIAALEVAVQSQVALLYALHGRGLLVKPDPTPSSQREVG